MQETYTYAFILFWQSIIASLYGVVKNTARIKKEHTHMHSHTQTHTPYMSIEKEEEN